MLILIFLIFWFFSKFYVFCLRGRFWKITDTNAKLLFWKKRTKNRFCISIFTFLVTILISIIRIFNVSQNFESRYFQIKEKNQKSVLNVFRAVKIPQQKYFWRAPFDVSGKNYWFFLKKQFHIYRGFGKKTSKNVENHWNYF